MSKIFLLFLLLVTCFLIALPKVPLRFTNQYVNIDTSVGGYRFTLAGKNFDFSTYKTGLDIAGGVRLTLLADTSSLLESEKRPALDSAREIIERRINYLGITEPIITISTQNDAYRIIVEIPGVSDLDSAVSLIGQTAQIVFRELTPSFEWSPEKFEEIYFSTVSWQDTNLTGSDLTNVEVLLPNGASAEASPSIRLIFSADGRKKFAEVAKRNINKPIGIFFNNEPFPLSAPVVSEDFANGVFEDPVINGNFSIEDAKNLSIQIRAGALPMPITVERQEFIEATLGSGVLKKSLLAGFYGFLAISLFMLVIYRRLGFVAILALVMYVVLFLAVFKLLGVVVTLAGIVGFLFSLAIAVDANVLVFERTREELLAGKPRNIAIDLGFKRAWTSIRDSNISSLITALILFYLSSGSVRGFALTLALGIVLSLFTSLYVTKTLIKLFKVDSMHPRTYFASLSSVFRKKTL